MHIRVLEDFIALARAGSFSRAAEVRNSTLSAFSRRIRQLEEEVGAPLVDRSQQPLVLTQSGTAFLEAAGDAVNAIRRGQDEIRAFAAADSRSIRFGVPHTLAQHYFPEIARRMRAAVPAITVQLVITTEAPTLLDIFEGGLCDLIIFFRSGSVSVALDPARVKTTRLARETLVPVCVPDAEGRPRFPLPGRKDAPSPFLHQGRGSYLGRVVEKQFGSDYSKFGLAQLPLVESDRPFPQLVLEGLGVVWLPWRAVAPEIGAGRLVIAASKEFEIPVDIVLARAADAHQPCVDAVWKALSEKDEALSA